MIRLYGSMLVVEGQRDDSAGIATESIYQCIFICSDFSFPRLCFGQVLFYVSTSSLPSSLQHFHGTVCLSSHKLEKDDGLTALTKTRENMVPINNVLAGARARFCGRVDDILIDKVLYWRLRRAGTTKFGQRFAGFEKQILTLPRTRNHANIILLRHAGDCAPDCGGRGHRDVEVHLAESITTP